MEQVLDMRADPAGLDVSGLSTDELEVLLVELEDHVGDVRSAQSTLLAEVDARQVPLADGCRSLNDWAAGRLDISGETASDLVRLSRTDRDHGCGSSDRKVATVKLAEAGASPLELELSRGFDISGVRRLVSQRNRLTRLDEESAFRARYLCVQPSLDESHWRVHGRLGGTDGRIVEEVLTRRAETLPDSHDGMGARRADALVSVCQDHATGPEGDGGVGPLLSVFVDASLAAPSNGEAGVVVESGPRVGVNVIEEILCGGTVEVIARAEDGTPLKYGRKTRVVSPTLKRAVLQRDGHLCTIAGCNSRYRLEAHHILPYGELGRTDPENLTTVCWYHHHVAIHGRGMRIDPDSPPQRRRLLPRRHPSRAPPP